MVPVPGEHMGGAGAGIEIGIDPSTRVANSSGPELGPAPVRLTDDIEGEGDGTRSCNA